jgi:putative tryptophan/tyrosine transport system substrate-binding protein
MINRRAFVALGTGALLVGVRGTAAQLVDGLRRVAILDPGIPHLFAAFRESMRELGYTEGRNIVYEVKSAEGNPDAIPALAAGLVRAQPDVIVTAASLPTRILMRQTSTIPIVVASIGDAVSAGIVRNLAQPVGNVTGMTFLNTELSGKRLELLVELIPKLQKVAVFNDPNSQLSYEEETERASKRLKVQLQRIDVRTTADLGQAYEEAKRGRAEAIDVLASPFFNNYRVRLVGLAEQYRFPSIYESREYAQAGGLMTYGQDLTVLFRRSATYVDKILKGAKPADLPWEQPTKFELVINLKIAKMLSLTIPKSLLLRADEVIE